jgi:hypothetical protein
VSGLGGGTILTCRDLSACNIIVPQTTINVSQGMGEGGGGGSNHLDQVSLQHDDGIAWGRGVTGLSAPACQPAI